MATALEQQKETAIRKFRLPDPRFFRRGSVV